MAVQHAAITLTTGQVSIAGDGLHGVLRVYIRNTGAGVAYLGASDVTTAAGFQLTTADAHREFVLNVGEQLFGHSTGAAVANVLRMNDTTSPT